MNFDNARRIFIDNKEVLSLKLNNKEVYTGLPNGYIAKKYIQSTIANNLGSYIKTGVKPNADYSISVTFAMVKDTATWDTVFGTRGFSNKSNAYGRFTARFTNKTGNSGTLGYQRSVSSTATSAEFYEPASGASGCLLRKNMINVFHRLDFDGRDLSVTNLSNNKIVTEYKFSASKDTKQFCELYLFALHQTTSTTDADGQAADYGNLKMSSCIIKDDKGNLLRNFIPCMRESDGVYGMYDLVNKRFYSSAGNAFTGG